MSFTKSTMERKLSKDLYHSQSGEEILHPNDDAGRTFKGKG